MGTDCHIMFEIKSKTSEEYEYIGDCMSLRNYKVFDKIKEYQNPGMPDHASWEVRNAYSEYSKECGYFSFGWMYYKEFLKHGGSKIWDDVYKSKLHDRIRVFIYFDN